MAEADSVPYLFSILRTKTRAILVTFFTRRAHLFAILLATSKELWLQYWIYGCSLASGIALHSRKYVSEALMHLAIILDAAEQKPVFSLGCIEKSIAEHKTQVIHIGFGI